MVLPVLCFWSLFFLASLTQPGLSCNTLIVGYYEDGHSEAWGSCITMAMAYIPNQDLCVTINRRDSVQVCPICVTFIYFNVGL